MTTAGSDNSSSVSLDHGHFSTSDSVNPQKHYLFTPAGFQIKLTVCILMTIAGAVGFVGNITVLLFIKKEEKKNKNHAGATNLHFFIRSLAISDVLVSLCAPTLWFQFFYDVFQTGWPCKFKRFIAIIFPVITINNLVVIGLERYICTCRPTSRPLSRAAVQKLVKGAWLLGCLITLLPTSTFTGVRVELNDTHYTIVCRNDKSNTHNIIIFQIFLILVYVFPLAILIFSCVSIIRVVWKRKLHVVAVHERGVALALKKWRLKQKKATTLLVALIVAFVVPYLVYFVYNTFKIIVKPSIDFNTDFIIRYIRTFLAYINSSVNFCIHLAQLPTFRLEYTKRMICFRKSPKVAEAQEKNAIVLQNKSANASVSGRTDHSEKNKLKRTSSLKVLKTDIKCLPPVRRHST